MIFNYQIYHRLNWKEAQPEHLALWKTSVPRRDSEVDEELR